MVGTLRGLSAGCNIPGILPFVIHQNTRMYRIILLILLFIPFPGKAPQARTAPQGLAWKESSVLNSGKWVKIKTTQRGIHKITFEKLRSWGFSSPEQVSVYGNGGFKITEYLGETPPDDLTRNRIWRGKDSSGRDCLFFFSTGTVKWSYDLGAGLFRHTVNPYSDDCFYFLTQESTTFQVEPGAPGAGEVTHTVTAFDDVVRYESEKVNLIRSGQQWFGEKFGPGATRSFTLTMDQPVAGEQARVLVRGVGRSPLVSSFEVTLNQVRQESLAFNAVSLENETSLYADERQKVYTLVPGSASLVVSLTYSATNALSEGYLDHITVNWRRQLRMTGDELLFRDTQSMGAGRVARFVVENAPASARIFDITDPLQPFEIPATLQGSQLSFTRPAGSLREYLAFKPDGNFPEPVLAGEIPNQNLHGLAVPDFVIITHPDFLSDATKVADFHRTTDGMQVEVVTTSQVYHEFGSGNPDASAIRNFIRMFYDRSKKIKYVLLFGDGCYDNRNITGANKAFIPTFQSDNSLVPTASFVSDDYFVILDEGESVYNGLVDIGIGRLPVSSVYEAGIVTGKILGYNSPESLGIWRTNLCFIGDDEDGNLHMSDSEALANQVNAFHREFQTEKVYFDAWPQQATTGGERYPGVVEAINRQVKNGVLILNYVGHANARFLADERVIDVSAINSWSNANNLPIFVTATCEFSRFDDTETSAGEYILLNPNGGGIGLFSTTRVVYAYSNFLLSRSFYQYVFQKDQQGENFRMGDIMRLAKINTLNTLNKRNFSLLADPALRLSYPKYKVVTTALNGKTAGAVTDTLKALSRVTVRGEVSDHQGRKLTGFNGVVTAVVYDKAVSQQTLGNGGASPFSYKVQNSIIYKGEATVTAGEFSFGFVVPKDISYNLGAGKILYYAQNGESDAHGAFEDFVIGGSQATQVDDRKGPEVRLYMDDPGFADGGETSQNPLMIAEISDENGINTVGTGVGHDITAILDGDFSNVIILNDYYQAAKDDFTKGIIRYPFRNLSVGEHTLQLRVWDVANNATTAEIKFVVSGDFYIGTLSNFPNPVYDHTNFIFTHNQPDGVFKTLVEVFDVTGTRVDSYQTSVSSVGTSSNPLRWNPRERGLSLRSGIYLYRITIRSSAGQLASRAGKMFLSR